MIFHFFDNEKRIELHIYFVAFRWGFFFFFELGMILSCYIWKSFISFSFFLGNYSFLTWVFCAPGLHWTFEHRVSAVMFAQLKIVWEQVYIHFKQHIKQNSLLPTNN